MQTKPQRKDKLPAQTTPKGKRIRQLLAQGKTPSQVHKIVGGSKQTIYGTLYKMRKEGLLAPKSKPASVVPVEPVIIVKPLTLWERIKSFFGV